MHRQALERIAQRDQKMDRLMGDEIMLIEMIGSKKPWMEPWDPTLDQLLDILQPENGNGASGISAADIMT